MTPFEALLRRGGAWLPSDAEGAVRIAGASQPFGPPGGGGTVDEWFEWPAVVNQDWPDDGSNVGTRFAATVPGEWIGVRVWRPITPVAPQSVYGINDDAGTLIAPEVALTGPYGAYVTQLFAAPVAIVPGVNYLAGFRTNRYGFTRVTEGATVPFLTEHLYTDGVNMSAVAKYQYSATVPPAHPWASSANFHYHVSPVVRFPA